MNSEKVKEIKELLKRKAKEYESQTYLDILTLINELESENERLMKLQARGGCRVAELGIENQQLKDRIAELEKENKAIKDILSRYGVCVITNDDSITVVDNIDETLNEFIND